MSLSTDMIVGIYGAADGIGRPLDGDTAFEVGSITKLLTALWLADIACPPLPGENFPDAV